MKKPGPAPTGLPYSTECTSGIGWLRGRQGTQHSNYHYKFNSARRAWFPRQFAPKGARSASA